MKINLRKSLICINQQKLIAIFLVFMFLGFTLAKPEFASSYSINNILCTMALYGIASLGMTLVILTGGTDLSAGSVMALSGVIGAGLLGKAFSAANPVSLPFAATVLIALIFSGLIGYLNGIVITKLKIAPFVATLAMMSIARGLVYVVADSVVQGVSGSPITFMNDGYSLLGQGKIGAVPVQFIVYVILFLIVFVFLKYTRTGRSIYTVGGNIDTAKLAGIKTNKIIVLTYTVSSILVGISGLILVGRLSSASTVAAKGYELDFITAVALGGTSVAGGRGSVIGTLLGTAFLAVLNNGLDIVNVKSFYQYLIKGLILVFAVCADLFMNKRVKKS
ncbi:MAG TPA: ABC transporter permease [Clostridiales bacterium]|nr:ABC transporter permease [Clostridiales bacterium]